MANPEVKQMKMQWVTIDGRTVPLVLPQIWDPDKEDWVVTSTENPLSVNAQLTGSNVEHQLMSNVEVSPGSTVFSNHITHNADVISMYVTSSDSSTFELEVRERRLDGTEAGDGTERIWTSYTNSNGFFPEFTTRTPRLNVAIRNESEISSIFSVWAYLKGVS